MRGFNDLCFAPGSTTTYNYCASMIQFADEKRRSQVREMWKSVFGDPDNYIDLYFHHKYRHQDTLLYMEGDKAVASLQMLLYQFTFCGTEIPVIYLSGVATLPAHRKKGYVRQLLTRSFEEAFQRDVPLMLLVPQEEWLLKFYDKYGFAQTFDSGTEPLLSLKALIEKYRDDLPTAFGEFDAFFRQKDMTVQKSFDDFRAIVEEAALYDFPAKRNLMGMARVIDAERMLSLFAAYYKGKSFSLSLHDELIEQNNALFTISKGEIKRELPFNESGSLVGEECMAVDVRELAQLLLGYHTSEKKALLHTLFPEKIAQMHFMLE